MIHGHIGIHNNSNDHVTISAFGMMEIFNNVDLEVIFFGDPEYQYITHKITKQKAFHLYGEMGISNVVGLLFDFVNGKNSKSGVLVSLWLDRQFYGLILEKFGLGLGSIDDGFSVGVSNYDVKHSTEGSYTTLNSQSACPADYTTLPELYKSKPAVSGDVITKKYN
eukprot:TRINITY_DN9351_c0_g1_i1.p1 TRINITY_DN9351_c0_g1~~TRINITY_DN9351_c0_g1_i1.p1  ORF type:complete len:166 (-),score=25.94 TRINITY_DN9351_c0_g1_i1:26-523(-)